jgi:hypothetical protein
MGDLLDTTLNVIVFVFIGLMVWLYLKETPVSDHSDNPTKGEGE